MNWFYAVEGQKNGPVSEAQLEELLRSGRINHDTLVWHEGMANWQTLGQALPAGVPTNVNPLANPVCVECGRTFPASELIRINHSQVCAGCKPAFLQRLSEGVALPSSTGLWRQNKRVVTVSETVFPDCCIKCNEPTNGFRMKRVLYWQHPAYLALILCNLLVLLIVVLIVRKKAVVYIGLCERHREQRKLAHIIGWSGFVAGIVVITAGAVLQSGIWALIGGVIFLGGVIYGIAKGRTVAAAKITKENVWISGVNLKFLDNLPEWPGP